jgi:uncharacterized protein (TIGR03382 family)
MPVIGGAPSAGDPAVVAIVERAPTCPASAPALVCSGTVIGERAVLTAAHCVDGRDPTGLAVIGGPDINGGDAAAAAIAVVEARLAPGYVAGVVEADLAVLVLDAPAGAMLATAAFTVPIAEPVRVVGYGATSVGAAEGGVKFAGTSDVAAVSGRVVRLAPGPAMTCRGDSGGPVLDGGGALIAVTSEGDPACALEAHVVRVDAHAAWLAEAMVVMPPPPRPAFDPAADLCAAPCSGDAECAAGLICRGTCTVGGLPPGQLGAPCSDDTGGPCVRGPDGCRRFTACGDAPDEGDGGCSSAPAPGGMMLGAVLMLAWVARRVAARANAGHKRAPARHSGYARRRGP